MTDVTDKKVDGTKKKKLADAVDLAKKEEKKAEKISDAHKKAFNKIYAKFDDMAYKLSVVLEGGVGKVDVRKAINSVGLALAIDAGAVEDTIRAFAAAQKAFDAATIAVEKARNRYREKTGEWYSD